MWEKDSVAGCVELDIRSWLLKETECVARENSSPVLVMSRESIRNKYAELRQCFGDAGIYYALKANPHQEIVDILRDLGCGFEVSSQLELDVLLESGVPIANIISSNPLKTEAFIRSAHGVGINLFAFDSYEEIVKLSRFAPGSKVCIRLTVSNEGSEWPLSKKFGVDMDQALGLLLQAREMGLDPVGITFHVGSQCTNPKTWARAIEDSAALWNLADNSGLELDTLNIGGGLPAEYTRPVPGASDIASVVRDAIKSGFRNDPIVIIEPGRFLVGEAGILASTVMAKASRGDENWLYLDVGVFNGLMESVGGIEYDLKVGRDGLFASWVLAGPSCDSFDVISKDVTLPNLEVGDRVYIMSTGAYTTAYASHFNGFSAPTVCFI